MATSLNPIRRSPSEMSFSSLDPALPGERVMAMQGLQLRLKKALVTAAIANVEVQAEPPAHAEGPSVAKMVADPLLWLQNYTQTRDSHWREAGAKSPYRPFPKKAYFCPIVE